jgi:hypothetical protein
VWPENLRTVQVTLSNDECLSAICRVKTRGEWKIDLSWVTGGDERLTQYDKTLQLIVIDISIDTFINLVYCFISYSVSENARDFSPHKFFISPKIYCFNFSSKALSTHYL